DGGPRGAERTPEQQAAWQARLDEAAGDPRAVEPLLRVRGPASPTGIGVAPPTPTRRSCTDRSASSPGSTARG
ncbi:hypothetical protein ACWCQE_38255, partial [Streptomyces sp. NPDC002409]